jgi:hypothetical protein
LAKCFESSPYYHVFHFLTLLLLKCGSSQLNAAIVNIFFINSIFPLFPSLTQSISLLLIPSQKSNKFYFCYVRFTIKNLSKEDYCKIYCNFRSKVRKSQLKKVHVRVEQKNYFYTQRKTERIVSAAAVELIMEGAMDNVVFMEVIINDYAYQ